MFLIQSKFIFAYGMRPASTSIFSYVSRYHPTNIYGVASFRTGLRCNLCPTVSSGARKGTRVLSCPLAIMRCSCHFPLFPFYSSPLLLLTLLRTYFSCHTLEVSDQPPCIPVLTEKELAFSRYCRPIQNVSLQSGSAVMLIIPKDVNYRVRHDRGTNPPTHKLHHIDTRYSYP